DGEDLIEAGKDGQQGVAVGGARGALIERNIGGADQFEDGGQRLGGVEIVGEGGIHCRLGGGGGLAPAGSGLRRSRSRKPRRRSRAAAAWSRPSRVKLSWRR